MVEFGVLGDIEARINGVTVDLGPARQRCVLATLLIDVNRAVPMDQLIERVWGDRPPQRAQGGLYSYLSHLRKILEPAAQHVRIARQPGGYVLLSEAPTVDLHRFRDLVARARADGDDDRSAALFEEGLALWRGEAFLSIDTPWFNASREAVHRERRTAELDRNDIELRRGRHTSLLDALSTGVAVYPLDERLARQFMLALYRSGRAADALRCFEQVRRELAEELGCDPGRELREFHQQILNSDPSLDVPARPLTIASAPARQRASSAASPHVSVSDRPDDATGRSHEDRGGANTQQPRPRLLPPTPSLFVGREDELAEACRLLGQEMTGSVTLLVTGSAGVGKTAFAVRTGHLLASRFPDGQLYVDLRGFGDEPAEPFTVLGTFLRALGVHGGAMPPDTTGRINLYRTLLAQRRILVVLDSAADTLLVDDLLPSGEHCAAIVTSRTTLASLGGVRLPLRVLDSRAGLALLREMVGADRTAEESESARSIVETCGGLPLAVWVTGARLAARPHWPLARVARALADEQRKLDELAVGHIAVRASLELTYRGMAPMIRHALRMLALLPGPDFAVWALAALLDMDLGRAEAVLDELVDVHVVEVGATGATGVRYRLHDLVRLVGRERADREVSPQGRSAALTRLLGASLHLADLAADTLSVDFQGISQAGLASWRPSPTDTTQILADPLAWFNDERQLLIDVVDQALDRTEIAPAAGLATALTTLFQIGSHFDDWERLQNRALKAALSSGSRRSATQLHRCLGELTTILDRYPEALDHFEQALQFADGEGPAYRASATAGLAYVYRLLGQYSSAVHHFGQAIELARTVENVNCLVYATNGIGVIHLEQGHVEAAMERFTQCLRASREAGYRHGEAQALRCLGQSHRARGAYPAAADCFRQAASISESLGDRLTTAHATCWLGDVLVRQGAHAEGRRLLARTLWTYREFGNLWGEAATLYALAEAQLVAGRPAPAGRRAEAAVRLWRQIGSRTWLAVGLDTLAKAHTMAGDLMAAARAQDEASAVRVASDAPVTSGAAACRPESSPSTTP
ncbi:BTAD domain-containing putative transcriptional regulator [Streptomyces sp. Ncost-T10-10d]|uniref:AfsR/SARP family transcriptional regulator n=1 Tax=Streptomyces sp. Ncost-T10-10d TaxID=1839774 RepID=UPI00081D839C|nr:BTAD domain-containing putative transcriptional regulator [Streptomyces sp. Ncost-T10-10d]SCF83342.1 DNA-binding transcriptional activator of the SARP family [Streptomyces sp. Ncost-T10-10d]